MTMQELFSIIKDAITILAILIGGLAGLFIFFQLAPVLTLLIETRWADDEHKYLIVKCTIKNSSRVRVLKPRGRIQVLKHDPKICKKLSSWVPFEKEAIKPEETPIEWQEPQKFFMTTERIYPGESIITERMYHIPERKAIIHIGLQVNIRLSAFGRLATRKKGEWGQTTTSIVMK